LPVNLSHFAVARLLFDFVRVFSRTRSAVPAVA
jgi:hypothetical protein